MRNFKYLLFLSLTLIGCAPEQTQTTQQIQDCLNQVNFKLSNISSYKKYEYTPYGGDPREHAQGEYYQTVKGMHDEMTAFLSNPKAFYTDTSTLPFDFKNECKIDRLDSYYDEKMFYIKRDEALKQADAANAEIDKALDDVIDDYKKQAVKHFTSNGGSNIKVDTFILKNGKTVHCKTSITDAGKAVDCN